ncbi:MAG TPA: sigma-54 dependent transcriptional regulator [Gemmatimonadales bacterium]|jgi:DNA-binding NtrC family response regulator
MSDRVLLTMDDLESAVPVNAAFEAAGFQTALVSSRDDGRAVFRSAQPDLVVLTGALHDRPAAVLARLAREHGSVVLGFLETSDPDPQQIARELGGVRWMRKPVEPGDVVQLGKRLIARRRLQERTGILGESSAIQEVLVKIEQMAPVSSTVLVEGESGTGKELVAQAIHALSPRRNKPFIAVNCAALPESLLESELFGHEKGAFTGAAERRLGRFELASEGTIFLDEIGEMPHSVQVKLLRVLENRSFFRVGGTTAIRVDVRVIAATNRSLKEAVAVGDFRDDLFYRLNVLSIYLPPLRERKADVPMLVDHFIRQLSLEHGRTFVGIAPDALEILVNAHWPGNIRELRNLLESMVVLAPGRQIRAADIPLDVSEGGTRFLPVRVSAPARDGTRGKELEFIFRSLVELKLQVEELRRRIDQPQRVEVVEVESSGRLVGDVGDFDDTVDADLEPRPSAERLVLYRSGMTMSDVERAAIEAALEETAGNRRKAAEGLGIGERTLYRKIKEFGLA